MRVIANKAYIPLNSVHIWSAICMYGEKNKIIVIKSDSTLILKQMSKQHYVATQKEAICQMSTVSIHVAESLQLVDQTSTSNAQYTTLSEFCVARRQ